MEFEFEVQTLEPLLFVLRRFIEQLVLRLAAIYRVPAAMTLCLRFDDGQEHCRQFRIPAPTGNVETLFRVVHTHLENFVATVPGSQPPFGGDAGAGDQRTVRPVRDCVARSQPILGNTCPPARAARAG